MNGLNSIKETDNELDTSGFDTAVAYRRLRQQLPDYALIMPLQLSLSPLRVRPAKDRQHGPHIASTLAALIGPTGCLPPHYEETALAQALIHDHSYAAFIALFQRHFADLLIEASTKYSVHRQNRWKTPAQNPFLNAILAITGCGQVDKKDIRQSFAIQFAALFANDRRNAVSLKAMLEALFNIPVEIAEFHPRWQPIPDSERSLLNGRYRLGIDTCIGSTCKNAAGRFRVILGPLAHSQFRQLLPDQPSAQQLVGLIRLYCGIGLSFDIQLVLAKKEVPAASLPTRNRLGCDLWLTTGPSDQHRDDAVFDERIIPALTAQDINYAS